MTDQVTDEQFERISAGAYLLSDQQKDEKKDFLLRTVIDEILAYCYRSDIPPALERIISRIAANVLSSGYEKKGNLTSYREGDASWTWDYSPANNAFNEANLLERFRCIRSINEDDDNSVE